jgi:hypothetical protein
MPAAPAVPATPAVAPAPIAPAPAATATPAPTATPQADPAQPAIKHAFVIWLAGHGGDAPMPYLDGTLRRQGVLLDRYAGVAKGALPNGLGLLAGKPGDRLLPDGTPTLASRLADAGLTMRAYQEDPCDAPVERNPLSYAGGECATMDRFGADVSDAANAPQVLLLTPNACSAGADGACPPDGQPSGPARADAWLSFVVPAVLGSPAYADGGLLVIAFDEGGPALVVSPFAGSGTTDHTRYDHYALHRTLARIFGVEPAGRAARETVAPFGPDLWAATR